MKKTERNSSCYHFISIWSKIFNIFSVRRSRTKGLHEMSASNGIEPSRKLVPSDSWLAWAKLENMANNIMEIFVTKIHTKSTASQNSAKGNISTLLSMR